MVADLTEFDVGGGKMLRGLLWDVETSIVALRCSEANMDLVGAEDATVLMLLGAPWSEVWMRRLVSELLALGSVGFGFIGVAANRAHDIADMEKLEAERALGISIPTIAFDEGTLGEDLLSAVGILSGTVASISRYLVLVVAADMSPEDVGLTLTTVLGFRPDADQI